MCRPLYSSQLSGCEIWFHNINKVLNTVTLIIRSLIYGVNLKYRVILRLDHVLKRFWTLYVERAPYQISIIIIIIIIFIIIFIIIIIIKAFTLPFPAHQINWFPIGLHTSRKGVWPFSPYRISPKHGCFKHAFWISNLNGLVPNLAL